MKRPLFVLLLLGAALSSGCIFIPAIDAYNQMGLSKVDCEKLLGKEVKKFQDALYWGQSVDALAFVADDKRNEIGPQLQKELEGVRVVESKIVGTSFSEDSYQANVTVQVRFYKVPFYVVTDRNEKQKWEFSVSSGWKYSGIGEYQFPK